jgi:hypothetical protein
MMGIRRTPFPGLTVPRLLLILCIVLGCEPTLPSSCPREHGGPALAGIVLGCEPSPPRRTPSAEPRCAFLAAGQSTLSALAEAKLLEGEHGTWLERSEIDQILAEHELAASFAPETPQSRIALGRLLKADVLVLMRSKQEQIDLVVAETTGGLRILARSIPESPDPEADADKLVGLVNKAMAKYGETIDEVYAVPPFLSRDFGYDNDHLMSAYAELTERLLLTQPGVLVVETAEAEAIAREYALAAPDDRPQRRLPIYLWGEYRHEGRGDSRRIKIRLETKRGDTVLDSTSHTMRPDQVPGYLLRAAVDLLGQRGTAAVDFDAQTEARELTRRCGEFLKLRDWQQALTLAELSTLLVPDQVDAHTGAILALAELRPEPKPRTAEQETEAEELRLRLRRRTLHHLRQALESEHGDRVSVSTIETAIGYPHFPPLDERPELSPEIKRHHEIEQDYALKMAYHYADRGVWDKSRVLFLAATRRMPRKRDVDERLAFLAKCQHVMDGDFKCRLIAPRYMPPKEEVAGLWRTLLSWEDLDEDLRCGILVHQRHVEEALAGQKRREEQKRQWESAPATLPPASSALTFRALEIPLERRDRPSVPMPACLGCLPLDDGSDVFWNCCASSCHVEPPGQARFLQAARRDGANIQHREMVSDGRYLWITAYSRKNARHRLDVVEPRSRETWSITEEHGLPTLKVPIEAANFPVAAMRVRDLQVAPLAHGEAIVVGFHVDTFMAHVRFDPHGDHRVRVFHEAKEIHTHEPNVPLGGDHDDSCWNTQIAFRPSSIGTWTDPKSGQRRVVVRRQLPMGRCDELRNHALIVNPDDFTVSVMAHEWHPFNYRRGSGQFYLDYSQRQWNLMHFEHAERRPVRLFSDVLYGHVVPDGDTVHVVGRQWQRGSLTDGSWQSLGETPWEFVGRSAVLADVSKKREFELLSVYRSNVYGLVVVLKKSAPTPGTPWFMAQVLLDGSGDSFQKVSSSW